MLKNLRRVNRNDLPPLNAGLVGLAGISLVLRVDFRRDITRVDHLPGIKTKVIFMEFETINKLYLELSQIATAKTKRELELEDILTSARAIADRAGEGTNWQRFSERIEKAGIGSITAKTFRILPSDVE